MTKGVGWLKQQGGGAQTGSDFSEMCYPSLFDLFALPRAAWLSSQLRVRNVL